MTYAYSDPEREDNLYALPNIEIWSEPARTVGCRCGDYEIPLSFEEPVCPSCDGDVEFTEIGTVDKCWFWFCFPGCLPDSNVFGPFDSEEEALEEARSWS